MWGQLPRSAIALAMLTKANQGHFLLKVVLFVYLELQTTYQAFAKIGGLWRHL